MVGNIKQVFAVSLILNFIFIGFLLGRAVVPQANKVTEYESQHKEYSLKVNQLKKEILDIVAADIFDKKLYEQKVAELRFERTKMMENLSEQIENIALRSNKQQRLALVNNLDHLDNQIINIMPPPPAPPHHYRIPPHPPYGNFHR